MFRYSNDIESIIQILDLKNKAYGSNKISICMIKICGKSICKPLQLIFNQCFVVPMREQYLMKCSGFLLKTIWFSQTNLVSSQGTPVLTRFYLYLTKYINLLMTVLKWEVLFLISQRALDEVWHKGIIFKLEQNFWCTSHCFVLHFKR